MANHIYISENRLETMAHEDCKSEIIDLLKSGETTTAFDRIIDRYNERLYWHIRRIVVLHEDAEDLLQETFVAAFTNAESFRGENEGSLAGWLYKIATNLSIKTLKRRRRGIFTSIDSLRGQLLSSLDSELSPSADEIEVKLQRAVTALPMKQKLVFNMRYYDEMPFEQIAQATGQNVGTLKTNYHYAVEKVKRDVTTIKL